MNHWHQRNDSVVNASKCPLEKTHRVGWDSLLAMGDWSGNGLSMTWKKVWMFVFNGIDLAWCVKGLIVTRSNLSVLGRLGPGLALFLEPPGFVLIPRKWHVFFCYNWICFHFVPSLKYPPQKNKSSICTHGTTPQFTTLFTPIIMAHYDFNVPWSFWSM